MLVKSLKKEDMKDTKTESIGMALEPFTIKMEENIADNGIKIKWKEKESFTIKTVK